MLEFDLQRFAVNKVPEMVTDAKVYLNGQTDLYGIANIDMPELASQTTSITGTGLMGEIDAPVRGHFGSMELTLNWRTPVKDAFKMSGGVFVAMDIYANLQNVDSGYSEYNDDSLRIVVRGRAKSYAPGTLEGANTSDSSNTIEVHYLKVEINSNVVLEIDKYNNVFTVDGEDLLAQVRRNLGME